MEWGCMQALIDFDGWRKWKDFSSGGAKPDKSSINPKNLSTAIDAPGKDVAATVAGKGPSSPNPSSKVQRRDKRLSNTVAMEKIDSGSGTGSGSEGTGIESGDGGIMAGA